MFCAVATVMFWLFRKIRITGITRVKLSVCHNAACKDLLIYNYAFTLGWCCVLQVNPRIL